MPEIRPGWLDEAGDRFVGTMPVHIERLGWDVDRLRDHQNASLRSVLRAALEGSAFHRRRLAGVDIDAMTVDRLPELPVMTKAELVADFDDVVTDPRLRRDRVESHLASIGATPELIDGTFLALVSGGSSGRRGIYCYHRDAVPEYLATILRPSMAQLSAVFGWPLPFRPRVTLVAAPSAIHATAATSHLLTAFADVSPTPATLPFEELIRRVEASTPMLLVGYTAMIARLADARRAGRLSIEPQGVVVTSEQLTDDLCDRIVAGFGMPPANSFASSEGVTGSAPPGEKAFTFASDTAYVEFVDDHDRPVAIGEPAHHVLVTHLANTVQPLIRFRIDDRMTPLPPDPAHGHQRALVSGRDDTTLSIGGVTVHPLVIRTTLLRHGGVVEHQTVANGDRIDVRVVTDGPVDLRSAEAALCSALHDAGATIAVHCHRVETLDRDPATGKARPIIQL